MFALRHKKSNKLMSFYTSANDGDFCVDVTVYLTISGKGDPIWVVGDKKIAEIAAVTDEESYNADFCSPMNRFVGELEVVELSIKE